MSGEGVVQQETPAGGPVPQGAKRPDSLARKFLYVLRRDWLGMSALGFLAVMVAIALFGPILLGSIATDSHLQLRFLPPLSSEHGWQYVLGSDALGRSYLGRLVVAARTTLGVAGLAVIVAALVGTAIGTTVGYLRGRFDALVMRLADVLLAFPSLLLALIVLYTVGPGLASLVLVLAVARFALYARVARGESLGVRERLFVAASRALGAGSARIIFTQILPVILPTIATLATLEFSLVMLSESALSFLGLGVQAPDITWGGLIAEGRNYLRTAWWIALFPGLAITATAIAVNLLADVLRRATETD